MKTPLSFLFLFVSVFCFGQPCHPAPGGTPAGNGPPGCLMVGPIYAGTTQPYSPSAPGSAGFPCGTIENNQFISVIADNSGTIECTILASNCQNGSGVQLVIYDQLFNPVSNCYSSMGINIPGNVVASGLTPGEIYWMMIDGYAGDICDILVTATGIDVSGDLGSYYFSLRVFSDEDNDCEYDTDEFPIGMGDFELHTSDGDTIQFFENYANNYFYAPVEDQTTVTLKYKGRDDYPWWEPCFDDSTFTFISGGNNTYDFPMDGIIDCPYMTLDIEGTRLSICRNRELYVRYKNEGTITADSVLIKILIPDELGFISANAPIIDNVNDTIFFHVGAVDPGVEGKFRINVKVGCPPEVMVGQGICVEGFIYPNEHCGSSVNWNRASVDINRSCESDGVHFTLKNNGSSNTGLLEYSVMRNDTLIEKENFSLNGKEELEFVFPDDGGTYRMTSTQVANFPGKSFTSLAIEGCGVTGSTNSNTGFLTSQENVFGSPFTDIYCDEVVGSYDPNDKQAVPFGVGAKKYITKETDLEYLIRFQNTGNDTAFFVQIVDTIPSQLDFSSIELMNSSHPCNLKDGGNNILRIRFNNILLVDSITNEPRSHGFVKFRISPKKNLAQGTEIFNSASIYFDFNLPIKTNFVLRTVEEDFIPSSTDSPFNRQLNFEVVPNPFSDFTKVKIAEANFSSNSAYQIRVMDISGKEIFKDSFKGDTYQLNRRTMSEGIFFLSLSRNGQPIGVKKLVVN